MSNYLWRVIAAGALGVLYGLVQTASLMKASTGKDNFFMNAFFLKHELPQ
jgi:hypothetical protein